MKELRRIQADPEDSILVVIDMDNETSQTVGGLPEPNPELSTKRAIIPTVRRLIDRAHDVGVQVIYVQSVRNHREPQFTTFRHALTRKIGTQNSRIVDELTPEPRDIIVRKWNHDPWYQTDLERVLDGLVTEPTKCQALITGGAGSGCAFFGTKGFYIRNFQTVFVVDAVYGGPTVAARHFSRTSYPTFPNIFLSRSEMIEFSKTQKQAKCDSQTTGIAGETPVHYTA
ncbi:MAG: isochorismatase family cysteine hydrolase [Candidatus Binatia bacterium]